MKNVSVGGASASLDNSVAAVSALSLKQWAMPLLDGLSDVTKDVGILV